MISYAPLVANADYKDAPWHGCINFDTYRVYGTPFVLRSEDILHQHAVLYGGFRCGPQGG